jgi:hypothetical protein
MAGEQRVHWVLPSGYRGVERDVVANRAENNYSTTAFRFKLIPPVTRHKANGLAEIWSGHTPGFIAHD